MSGGCSARRTSTTTVARTTCWDASQRVSATIPLIRLPFTCRGCRLETVQGDPGWSAATTSAGDPSPRLLPTVHYLGGPAAFSGIGIFCISVGAVGAAMTMLPSAIKVGRSSGAASTTAP